MTTSTRKSGTSFKRLLGADGSAKYQANVGLMVSLITLPVASLVTSKKIRPVKAALITAAATTAAAIIVDKSKDKYYTKTEYAIMFGTFTAVFTGTFATL